MDAKNNLSRKKCRREPLVIPVALVSEGCSAIAENISELTNHAVLFLGFDEEIVSRRIPHILLIHAIDEAGKLLELIRKMAEAEHSESSSISIEGFYSHSRKGSQAGSIGLQTIDWLQSVVERLSPSRSEGLIDIEGYRIHLESLKENFCGERENALYVDLYEGHWLSPATPDEGWLSLDAALLGVLASLTLDALRAGLPVSYLDGLAKHAADPATVEELAEVVRKAVYGKGPPS